MTSSRHAHLFEISHYSILFSKDTGHHATKMNMVPYSRTYCKEKYVSSALKEKKKERKRKFKLKITFFIVGKSQLLLSFSFHTNVCYKRYPLTDSLTLQIFLTPCFAKTSRYRQIQIGKIRKIIILFAYI